MPPNELWAGALSLYLRHTLTGCPRSAHQAARLLDRLAGMPEIDAETRTLCEQASLRLALHRATSCRESATCTHSHN